MRPATGDFHVRPDPVRSIASILLMALLVGCGEEVAEEVDPIRPVIAQRTADVSGLAERSFPGRASAEREVNLSFRVPGPLITLPVDIGDEVKQGDVVARIDPRDFEVLLRNTEAQHAASEAQLAAMRKARPEDITRAETEVAKAEAAAKLAEQDLSRLVKIRADDPGAVAQSALDRAEDQKSAADALLSNALQGLRIAETGARKEDIAAKEAEIASLDATVDSASDNLSYTYLKAPFDGIVTQNYVENFETVVPKQPILRLLDSSRIEFTIFVAESQIGYAPYVQSISVRFDALPGLEVDAAIKEIAKEASQATRTYPVTLILDQPED
ncbi:MAG: HlyD family secretion protein, partial [Geminicoccaceae bacterium]